MTPTGTTTVAGVIGWPVRHSLSPVIVNAAFDAVGLDWVFAAFEVPPGEAAAAVRALRALHLGGLSVTMPHKEDAARAVDRCSDEAEALGAVNCVAWDGEDVVGHNTDGSGFLAALRSDLDLDPTGRRVAVLGAGGAARAVVLALAGAGASEIVVVNRTPERAERAVALAGAAGRIGRVEDVARVDLVVNATPVGMTSGGSPVPVELLGPAQFVVDLVYHPAETELLADAARQGARTANGLGMLVHQAAHAVRRWTGVEPPIEPMVAAARAALDHPPLPQHDPQTH